jgi:hypothetical protein
VDLTKLKPKTSDSYPYEIAMYIHNNEFKKKYEEVIEANFAGL